MHRVQRFNMVIGWKTYPEKTILYHFHAEKALFNGPKSAIYVFGLEMTLPPPPLWNFSENSSVLVTPSVPIHPGQMNTDDDSLTIQVATEKGRSMGNAVGCPTEWADEMEEREILQNSAFF